MNTVNMAWIFGERKENVLLFSRMKIIEIEGIGEKYAKILEDAGYANVEDLIPLKWREVKGLAEMTKISLKLIEKWQDQEEIRTDNRQ